jgi:hypothetical protein
MAASDPAALSAWWRHGRGDALARRRRIIGLSLASVGLNGLLALYQTGIVKRLPDPPLPIFNSEKVPGSAQGYSYFATPDAALAVGSYAATLALAAMSGPDRGGPRPVISLLLAAKIAFDAAFSGKLAVDQWIRHRALCLTCLAGTATTLATIPPAIPEAREALQHLMGRR